MALTFLALALAAANPAGSTDEGVDRVENPRAELAVAALASGESNRAIRKLQGQLSDNPSDPALMINLGIAFAQKGDIAKARALFEAAMSSPEVFDLETADGSAIDSRRLARKAISMLDRGEFNAPTQLTMRE